MHLLRWRAAGLVGVSWLALVALGQAATPDAARVGMVDEPCPAPIARPIELDELTDLMLGEAEPDPAARARLLTPAVEAYGQAQAARRAEDWADLCHFHADNAALVGAGAVRAVFLGDSITEAWLRADPSFFTGGRVDRGISGQTSQQMLLRFYSDVVALHPQVVHILAGTNDLAGNTGPTAPVDFQHDIMAMTDIALAHGIRVVLGSIPPADHFSWRPQLQPAARIVELNAWLRRFAAERGVVYVDYYAVLVGANGALRSELTHDGVHPERRGYALMRPLTERALAQALR